MFDDLFDEINLGVFSREIYELYEKNKYVHYDSFLGKKHTWWEHCIVTYMIKYCEFLSEKEFLNFNDFLETKHPMFFYEFNSAMFTTCCSKASSNNCPWFVYRFAAKFLCNELNTNTMSMFDEHNFVLRLTERLEKPVY